MTLPPISAMIESLRHLLARELGISPSAPAGLWWLRLLFRAPPPGRPDVPLRCAIWLRRRARTAGDRPQHGAGIWLRRLLLRAPRAIRPLAADLRQRRQPLAPPEPSALHRWFRSWLEPTYFRLKRLRRRLMARLPQVDWRGITHRLEALSPALGRVPLLMPVLLVLAAVSGILLCTTPLPLRDQFLLVVLILAGLFILRRIPGRLATLSMAALSVLMAGRYIWWRVTTTLRFETTVEAVFGYLLLAAEFYTWIVLFLGYIQTIWPLNRRSAGLPPDPADWPTIDVFIPTYNECCACCSPPSMPRAAWTGPPASYASTCWTTAAARRSAPSPRNPACTTWRATNTRTPRRATSTRHSGRQRASMWPSSTATISPRGPSCR